MTDQPAHYRRRPLEVEAIQWTGTNAGQLRAFAGSAFDEIEPEYRTEDPDATAMVCGFSEWMLLRPGDWVVRRGEEFEPLNSEEFTEMYAPTAIEEQQEQGKAAARRRMTSAVYDSLAAFNQVACWDVLRLAQMRLYLAEHIVETLMPEARGWALFCRSGQTAWTLIDTYEADERPQAEAALAHRRANFPAIEYRLAQATTVYTPDGEQL